MFLLLGRVNFLELSGWLYDVFELILHLVVTSGVVRLERNCLFHGRPAAYNHCIHLYGTIYDVTIWRNSLWRDAPCSFIASGNSAYEILPDVIVTL